MTMDEPEDEARAGPSTSQMEEGVTPKLGLKYFDREMCYAPPRKFEFEKKRKDLCNTIMPVLESPMSPPEHERGPSVDTPFSGQLRATFMRHTMYKIQYPTRMSAKYFIPDAWFAVGRWTRSKTKR